jgi:hypothetical protein
MNKKQTLSEYLKNYLKKHLFNNKRAREVGESFDEMLQRVLQEGIFDYRRYIIADFIDDNIWEKIEGEIANALINAEDEESLNKKKYTNKTNKNPNKL